MWATGTLPVASQIRIIRRMGAESRHHSRRLGKSAFSARIVSFLGVRVVYGRSNAAIIIAAPHSVDRHAPQGGQRRYQRPVTACRGIQPVSDERLPPLNHVRHHPQSRRSGARFRDDRDISRASRPATESDRAKASSALNSIVIARVTQTDARDQVTLRDAIAAIGSVPAPGPGNASDAFAAYVYWRHLVLFRASSPRNFRRWVVASMPGIGATHCGRARGR